MTRTIVRRIFEPLWHGDGKVSVSRRDRLGLHICAGIVAAIGDCQAIALASRA